jgi:hypothetical protein
MPFSVDLIDKIIDRMLTISRFFLVYMHYPTLQCLFQPVAKMNSKVSQAYDAS